MQRIKVTPEQTPIALAAAGLILIGFAVTTTPINFENPAREQRQTIANEQQQLQIQQEAIAHNREIANQRYNDGLVFIVDLENPQSFTAISPDRQVVDGIDGLPLADGIVVGDVWGTTAIIKDGYPTSIATTGDREVIDAAIARARAKGNVLAPGQ